MNLQASFRWAHVHYREQDWRPGKSRPRSGHLSDSLAVLSTFLGSAVPLFPAFRVMNLPASGGLWWAHSGMSGEACDGSWMKEALTLSHSHPHIHHRSPRLSSNLLSVKLSADFSSPKKPLPSRCSVSILVLLLLRKVSAVFLQCQQVEGRDPSSGLSQHLESTIIISQPSQVPPGQRRICAKDYFSKKD